MSHPLVHLSVVCNRQVWAKQEPGAQDSIQVSYMDGRDPTTWAITYCLLGLQEARAMNKVGTQTQVLQQGM